MNSKSKFLGISIGDLVEGRDIGKYLTIIDIQEDKEFREVTALQSDKHFLYKLDSGAWLTEEELEKGFEHLYRHQRLDPATVMPEKAQVAPKKRFLVVGVKLENYKGKKVVISEIENVILNITPLQVATVYVLSDGSRWSGEFLGLNWIYMTDDSEGD